MRLREDLGGRGPSQRNSKCEGREAGGDQCFQDWARGPGMGQSPRGLSRLYKILQPL